MTQNHTKHKSIISTRNTFLARDHTVLLKHTYLFLFLTNLYKYLTKQYTKKNVGNATEPY